MCLQGFMKILKYCYRKYKSEKRLPKFQTNPDQTNQNPDKSRHLKKTQKNPDNSDNQDFVGILTSNSELICQFLRDQNRLSTSYSDFPVLDWSLYRWRIFA